MKFVNGEWPLVWNNLARVALQQINPNLYGVQDIFLTIERFEDNTKKLGAFCEESESIAFHWNYELI